MIGCHTRPRLGPFRADVACVSVYFFPLVSLYFNVHPSLSLLQLVSNWSLFSDACHPFREEARIILAA